MIAPRVNAETAEGIEGFEERGGIALLWFGFLGGAAAWFLDLVVKYSLVRYVCEAGAWWTLWVTAVVTIGVAAAAVAVAHRNWRRAGRSEDTSGGGSLGRSRFMALGGLAVSSYFLLVTVLTVVPPLVLDPCSGAL